MTQVLTDQEIAALRELRELWPDDELVLIGASALSLHVPLRWRVTQDLDVTVSVALSSATTTLSAKEGWTQSAPRSRRWLSPEGVRVDVLPVEVEALRRGRLSWPESTPELHLVGMRLAFDESVEMELAAGLSLPIATMPVITVLKMASYLDRPPERIRDLHDIAHLLHHYPDPADELSEQLFTGRVIELELSYTEAPAFLLGAAVAALVNDQEREVVSRFLAKVKDDEDADYTPIHLLRGAPESWHEDPAELDERVRAFELGLQES